MIWKKKRSVPEHSSEEEEREDWKEKNRQKKKNLPMKKQKQRQRSESATSRLSGQDSDSSSRDSSLSSRHSSSVDRLLEHQQQQLQQQQKQKLEAEHCQKGSLLSKVTKILDSCMNLKPLAKGPAKKMIPIAKQREPRRKAAMPSTTLPVMEEKKETNKPKLSIKVKPKNNSNLVSGTNSGNIAKEETKKEAVIIETSPVPEPTAATGRKMSATPAPLPAPVPPPANLLPSCTLPVKTVLKAESTPAIQSVPEHLSLEDGEIHGTDDAEDTVNDVEDIVLDNTESLEAAGVDGEQFDEQKQKVKTLKNWVFICYLSHTMMTGKKIFRKYCITLYYTLSMTVLFNNLQTYQLSLFLQYCPYS